MTVNYRPIIVPQRSENELQHGNEGSEIFLPAVDRSAGARSDSRTTFAVSRGRTGADRRAELSAETVNAAALNYSVASSLFNLLLRRTTFTSPTRCRVITSCRSCTAYPRRTVTSKWPPARQTRIEARRKETAAATRPRHRPPARRRPRPKRPVSSHPVDKSFSFKS